MLRSLSALIALAALLLCSPLAQAAVVWMTSPGNGASYTAPATVTVASEAEPIEDGERINSHRLYRNGAQIASGSTRSLSTSVSGLAAGTYQFRSEVTNNRGQTVQSIPVNITVTPPGNQSPGVSIGTPTGSPFIAPAPIGLSANAWDPDGWISRVDFYRDGNLVASDTSAPYEASYTAPNAGSYTFWAIATDNNGASTSSGVVGVTVNPNSLPSVSISAPVNGASYITPTTIPISANVSDSDGWISRVDFYANGAFLGSDTAAPYEASWSTGSIGGTRSISATVVDNKGGQATTAINVVLNTPTGNLSANPNPCTLNSGDSCNTTVSWTSNNPAAEIWRHYDHYVQTQEGPDLRHSETKVGTGASGSGLFDIGGTKLDQYFELKSGGSVVTWIAPGRNYPPWTTVTAPSANQLFHAPANIAISATGNDVDGTISRVDFYANGVLIGTDTSAPHEHVWTNAPAGTHTLTALAYDNYGVTRQPTPASATVSVTVNARPSVALTAPADGTVILSSQSVTLSANAADSDGTVTKVEFYADGALIATQTSSPYSTTWTPTTKKTYSLTAVAYDNRGAVTTSAARSLILNAEPVVNLTAPVSGSIYAASATITLSANATDSDGSISKVEFYSGSTLLGTTTAAPHVLAWSGMPAGHYIVTAKATDNRSTTTTSRARTVIVTLPGAISRRYVYDDHQQLCKTIEPETGATVHAYDPAGNLDWSAAGLNLPSTTSCDTTAASSSGRVVDRSYDTRNRLKTLSFPDGNGNQVWTYTLNGLPAEIVTSNDGGSTSVVNAYGYNKRGLPTGESQSQTGRATWTLDYGYDGNANLRSHVYPDGLTIDYAPNALGQPTQAGTYASAVAYYPNGAIKQFTYGNGITHTLTRNARGLPERSLDVYGGTAVLDDSYDYDANGNVAAISDGLPGNRGNRDMGYDALDRLTSTTSPMFGVDPLIEYAYDAHDNLKRVKGRGQDRTYVYDASNRLTNVTETVGGASVVGLGYDVQGNLANKNGQLYTFDHGNRLRAATGQEQYRYDAGGRRITAGTGAGSIWSLYGRDGALRFQQDERQGRYADYIYLAGSLVAKRTTTAFASGTITTTYQHTDALGSPVAVTDANSNIIERSEYAPYGALMNRPITDGPGYTGHVMDAATGLTYMQQRYYDPTLGRFLSVDPVTADGNTGGNFNRYWYASNNPYRFTDPDGRKPKDRGAAYLSENVSGINVNSAASQGMANIPRSWQQAGKSGTVRVGAGTSASAFTSKNAQKRYNDASREVNAVKETMEGTEHRKPDGAARTFESIMQPISTKYGVEIQSLIEERVRGYYLSGTMVGNRFRSDGIGYTVDSPSDGLPTIHSHPLSGGQRGSYYPFSDNDVDWYGSSPASFHYVTDPSGTYRFDGIGKRVQEVTP